MEVGLLTEVTEGLQRRKGHWPKIADALKPDVSYSMIAALGRGKYTSSPTLRKLERIAEWLRANPLEEATT
jgi:hypothetical protein